MNTILITGATGNVGVEVIRHLTSMNSEIFINAGVLDIEKAKDRFCNDKINIVKFDFTNDSTYHTAISCCDVLFLLRPPQLTDINKYFKPVIDIAKLNVRHIIFVSVQGVDASKWIPHHKIEKLIAESGIPYTFLRPAYFMENFTTTLRSDLVRKKQIFLPAGQSKFTLVSVSDIGKVAAKVIMNLLDYQNRAFDLTCSEKLTFAQMASKLSTGLGTHIQYQSPGLIRFYWQKRKENVPASLILVMIMLHYLPRFQKEPVITDCVKKITGDESVDFGQFIINHEKLLQ